MITEPSSRTRKMNSPTMATLCRKNREVAIASWPRACTSGPPAGPASGNVSVPAASATPWTDGTTAGPVLVGSMSGKSDPRVERGVQDVGEDVEDDDRGGCHHQPGLHHAGVRGDGPGQPLEQELAHAVPAEGDLGDHGTAEDGR